MPWPETVRSKPKAATDELEELREDTKGWPKYLACSSAKY